MKNNNSTSFIVFAGVIVLCVFTVVATINLLPRNNESNSYYVKVGDEMSAKIEALDIENNKLIITTSGDATEYCVKSTKSTPDNNNICWKKLQITQPQFQYTNIKNTIYGLKIQIIK